jgi:5-hydroxyisourate hydrolase
LGRLTTHVLNTAHGVPAAGMAVRLMDASRVVILETETNADGRCDAPLLEGPTYKPGKYIIAFSVAEYFREHGAELSEPPFLDVVEIAFGLADPNAHYHVPLLVSPWAYSTYRGS